MKTSDEKYLNRCLTLAKKGRSYVSPNPLVGAIIVAGSKIISEGYHHRYGAVHAEIDAISRCETISNEAILYCNLEPCSHRSSNKINPPCTETILNCGFKKVVIGMLDPNPMVNGKGVKELEKHGVEVTVLNHKASHELNRHYAYHITHNQAYVKLKIAQSLDAKIADAYHHSKWISSDECRKFVHRDRSMYDAVLSTAKTVNSDDAELTVRLVKGRNPKRLILDKNFEINFKGKWTESSSFVETILVTHEDIPLSYQRLAEKHHCQILSLHNNSSYFDLKSLFKLLYSKKIATVYIEAGANLNSRLIEANVVQEIEFHIANKIIGSGLSSIQTRTPIPLENAIRLKDFKIIELTNDIIIRGFVHV